MFEIMTVCTGNICRSPLAEVLLRARLADLDVRVHSAGTQGLDAAPMTSEAQRLAVEFGARVEDAGDHRSRFLTERDLVSPDLILALSREHRRRIIDMAPARMRRTFTAREFARLAVELSDAEIRDAATEGGDDQPARLRAAVAAVAGLRGMIPPPADAADDDVIDPYRRSWETYQLSASQLLPGVDQVVRVLGLAAAR
ncbi:arsenate reductase/protein-tyrosine-phosphatase family protein [Microbacterium sp. No. 7]|uniref:arsenate reductase/protein-tyrosine-phosphatase family protein n=1 Tax=Microbacterium sp. No. 7 TaxID=1714373 RepID=UPI0006ED10DD|nr:low molecular weight phosphatase family protein [Microbacterium sp. No. 7]ALJ19091.1 protein tyrosine phosphatase [Microbacterium sp. No. 7]